MTNEKIFNVPNFLSFYRIVAFPFVLWLAYAGKENMFALFLCINLVTDILDGFIARTFNLQTEFGAKLDSLADFGTYILAFIGVFHFKVDQFAGSLWMLWLFLFLFVFGNVLALVKFKKLASFHLYSMKIAGYAQGIFFFVLFSWQYHQSLFVAAMILGYISFTEEILVLVTIKKLKSNVKGLFWILKENKSRID